MAVLPWTEPCRGLVELLGTPPPAAALRDRLCELAERLGQTVLASRIRALDIPLDPAREAHA